MKTKNNKPTIVEPNFMDEADFDLQKLKRLPRGTFLAKPGDTSDPRKTKVRVTLYLDADVLDYFKQRAAQPNASPYQTQINYELRKLLEQGKDQGKPNVVDYVQLLQNRSFIAAVAEKVQEYQVGEAQTVDSSA